MAKPKKHSADFLSGLRMIYEDRDVIVVQKDAGILSQALRHSNVRSVEGMLTDYMRKGQLKSSKCSYLVHRLDRDTSGLMMVAKNEKTQKWFRDNWNDVTEKIYVAAVEGYIPESEGVLESYLREDENQFVKSVKNPKFGKYARTEWRTIAHGFDTRSLKVHVTYLKAKLKTGRKNQIRVQFAEIGHPVVGDRKYGKGRPGETLRLHAHKLSFRHPVTGKTLSFESELPEWAESFNRLY